MTILLGVLIALVSLGLILLMVLMGKVNGLAQKIEALKPTQVPQPSTTQAAPAPVAVLPPAIGDKKLFDAVVASAIATYMGTNVEGLRILSVNPLSGQDGSTLQRRQFVAVIAAAVAATLGTDVNGLRIHSITRIS